jgi:predicted porin
MNKKLLAVAVVSALAAPGVALAMDGSTVTISGFIKQGLESYSVSGSPSNTRLNTSQMRLVDSASRIYFNSTEDLGNGLKGVMQIDMRVWPNTNAAANGAGLDGGNTYVGLRSDTWGELSMGRRDFHYMVATIPIDNMASVAGPLQTSPTSIIDYVGNKSVGVGSQQNAVKWASPNWNGFSAVIGYSAEVGSGGSDMALPGGIGGLAAGTTTRKGDAWNVAPMYINGPFGVGYSYWKNKFDQPAAGLGLANERADTLWGYYTINGFKIGLGWNKIKLDDATGAGELGNRDAWTIPMNYTWGPHNVAAHYSVARDINTPAGDIVDSGARMFAIAYSYSFSKRTSVGLAYAKISNDTNINYDFFTSNGFGAPATGVLNGESPRMFQATIAHSF